MSLSLTPKGCRQEPFEISRKGISLVGASGFSSAIRIRLIFPVKQSCDAGLDTLARVNRKADQRHLPLLGRRFTSKNYPVNLERIRSPRYSKRSTSDALIAPGLRSKWQILPNIFPSVSRSGTPQYR